MPDVLIRNFPTDDLARLDEHAQRLGLSRSEFLRRRLMAEARRVETRVSVADLNEFSELVPDLSDPDVMDQAWS